MFSQLKINSKQVHYFRPGPHNTVVVASFYFLFLFFFISVSSRTLAEISISIFAFVLYISKVRAYRVPSVFLYRSPKF